MRVLAVSLVVGCWIVAQAAQTDTSGPIDCDAQAAIVKQAMTDRVEGVGLEETQTGLSETLGEEAGGMLARWIYDLPEGTSADDVAEAWKTQCAAL